MKTEKKAIIQKKAKSYVGFTALFSWTFHQKSWIDNKNRACNKLTGNIIKDFRPPIAGETDYQFIMESN